MYLDEKTIALIRDTQKKGINAKQLVEEQLELIYAKNWFNIWVSKEYKGLELNLIDGFNLIKKLAYWDGALAWTITLCSGANMFSGFIEPRLAKEVFKNPKVCFGGSGRVNGKAVWYEDKFHLTGIWQYATGAPHLTHFTLNAFVYDGDIQRMDKEGTPVIYSFFVPREDVLIHYDWDTFGLECTASHSFSLQNVPVDSRHAFELKPSANKIESVLYKIPFMTFAELTLLPNYLGMYQRFLDLVERYFFDKSKNITWAEKFAKTQFRQIDLFKQQAEAFSTKANELIDSLLTDVKQNPENLNPQLLVEIAKESRRMVKELRNAVITLFPLVGIAGAQRENELNIVFRNIFTATQHNLLNIDI